MKKINKNRELIKPQLFDQNELNDDLVTPYCSSGYSTSSSGTSCDSGYSCGIWSVSSPNETDDILI